MQRIAYAVAASALALGLAARTLAQSQPPKKPAAPKQPAAQKQPAAPKPAPKTLKCPICRTMDMTLEKTAKTPRAFKLGDQTWYCCDNDRCARGMAQLDKFLKSKKKP
jgi:hypothetical protein